MYVTHFWPNFTICWIMFYFFLENNPSFWFGSIIVLMYRKKINKTNKQKNTINYVHPNARVAPNQSIQVVQLI